MPTRILAGGVPEPDELFGREHVIRYIWEQLAGNNVLLVAPRRFGKTGVMTHLLKRTKPGYLAVYLDVEDIHDPEVFCTQMIAALLEHASLRKLLGQARDLPGKLMDFLARRVGGFKIEALEFELKEAIGESWESVVRSLIAEMENARETVIFILDEFPQLIENLSRKHGEDRARAFLQWFRSVRMKQKDMLRRYRFVLAGSTSIDMMLRKLAVPDKLNDFSRVPVEPLSADHASALLDALCAGDAGLQLSEEARAVFFDLVSPPVPYFIHLFVSQLRMEEKLRGRAVEAAEVHEVYERRVLGPTCRAYFDYYRERLKRYGDPGRAAALAILQEIAHGNGKVSNAMLFDVYESARGEGASNFEFDEIMADLESDWYVTLDARTNEYQFLLTLMRDWWKRFYRTLNPKEK